MTVLWWVGAVALLGAARAESAFVAPGGTGLVAVGVGLSTFQHGSAGVIRDRQVRPRLDLYGAWGLGERWQVSADLPVVAAFVVEHPDRGPCPSDDCAPLVTLGEAGVTGRLALWRDGVHLTAGLGLRTDAWNAGTRSRWTNAGQGVSSAVALLVAERTWGPGHAVVAWGAWQAVWGREVDPGTGVEPASVPSDGWGAAVEGRFRWGPLTLEGALTARGRAGGYAHEDWLQQGWSATEDRWGALAWRELAARAWGSWPAGEASSVVIGVGRVLVAANAPKDTWDVTIGVVRTLP